MSRRRKCEHISGIHRYRRYTNANGKPLWSCVDCPSFTYNYEVLIGKRARCYICDTPFVLSPYALLYAKVKCGTNTAECKARIAAEELDELKIEIAKDRRPTASLREILRLAGPISAVPEIPYHKHDVEDTWKGIARKETEREIVEDAIRSDSEQKEE